MADRKMLQQILNLVEEQALKIESLERNVGELVVQNQDLSAAMNEIRRATTVPGAPVVQEAATDRKLTARGPSLTLKWLPPTSAPMPVTSYTVEADAGDDQGFQIIYEG